MAVPSDLSGLRLWHKADAITGLVDGDPLASGWVDSSGNGFTATQATSAKRPIYKTNISPTGLAVVRFDGVDDELVGPAWPTNLWDVTTGVHTIMVAVNLTTASTASTSSWLTTSIVSEGGGWFGLNVRELAGVPQIRFWNFDTTDDFAEVAVTYGSWQRLALTHDNTTVNGYTDAMTSVAASVASGTTGGGANLSLAHQNGSFTGMDLGEVLVFDRVLTATERQDMAQYLSDRWISAPTATAVYLPTNRGPSIRQPGSGPRGLVERRYAEESTAAPTTLSDADSGAGTETSDVQATVPGSDTATGTETQVIAETGAGGDAGAGADSGTVSATVPGSDSGTGTDAAAASATVIGTDSGAGTDTASVSAQVTGSDSATGTDGGSVAQPTSGSDSGIGTESASVSVTAAGSDSAAGSDAQVVAETGAGGDSGAGFDAGTVGVTAAGTDAGTGTDSGTVSDVTGGPTVVAGSDSAAGTDAGTVVDLTPPPPPPDVGGGGRYEPDGDETAIYGEFIRLSDGDGAVAWDDGSVADLTPAPQLPRIRLPRRVRPVAESVPTWDSPAGHDQARALEAVAVSVQTGGEDRGVGTEGSRVVDLTVALSREEQEMWAVLSLSGVV